LRYTEASGRILFILQYRTHQKYKQGQFDPSISNRAYSAF
jgi:hypothetical protein